MSVMLNEYLRLEQEMLRLDATSSGESEAHELRDLMDLVWRRLPVRERELLNGRVVVLPVSRPSISVRVGKEFISLRPTVAARELAHARELLVAESDIWCAA